MFLKSTTAIIHFRWVQTSLWMLLDLRCNQYRHDFSSASKGKCLVAACCSHSVKRPVCYLSTYYRFVNFYLLPFCLTYVRHQTDNLTFIISIMRVPYRHHAVPITPNKQLQLDSFFIYGEGVCT